MDTTEARGTPLEDPKSSSGVRRRNRHPSSCRPQSAPVRDGSGDQARSRGPSFFPLRTRRTPRAGVRHAQVPEDARRSARTGAHGRERRPIHEDGRFLARTKLDELPQLWNVVRGEDASSGHAGGPELRALQSQAFEPILGLKPGSPASRSSHSRARARSGRADPTEHTTPTSPAAEAAHGRLYVERRSFSARRRGSSSDCRFSGSATARPVHRNTGRLNVLRRPNRQLHPLPLADGKPRVRHVSGRSTPVPERQRSNPGLTSSTYSDHPRRRTRNAAGTLYVHPSEAPDADRRSRDPGARRRPASRRAA